MWHQVVRSTPRSSMWVMGRLTNMQASMTGKYAIPSNGCNQCIVLLIGVLKGFVFLLPLGKIQMLYKQQESERSENESLQVAVLKDSLNLGSAWLEDMKGPYAHIELFSADQDHDQTMRMGTCFLNLPIMLTREVAPTQTLLVVTGRLQLEYTMVSAIFLEVEWIPE